jgi:hypothetical protein
MQTLSSLREEMVKRFDALAEPDRSSHRHDAYKHKKLPKNYIASANLLDRVRLAVLSNNEQRSNSVFKNATALHGMVGAGKSVIAQAICDDAEIQAHSYDGILWATLGQKPNLEAILIDWITVLVGSRPDSQVSLDKLKTIIKEVMDSRSCLFIVDDAWSTEHLEKLLLPSEKCRFLITTHNAKIATNLGIQVLPIPTMSEKNALHLFNRSMVNELNQIEPQVIAQIVQALGNSPLAITLLCEYLDSESQNDLLESDFGQAEEFQYTQEIRQKLVDAIEPTFETLDPDELKHYLALSIFKRRQHIPENILMEFWVSFEEYSTTDCRRLLEVLISRTLLHASSENPTTTEYFVHPTTGRVG